MKQVIIATIIFVVLVVFAYHIELIGIWTMRLLVLGILVWEFITLIIKEKSK